MGMKLVVVGVPGQISSIVAAAAFDQRNLSSTFGQPLAGEKATRETVNEWFLTVSGRTFAQVAKPRPGAIPNLPQSTKDDVNSLLDRVFGPGRPNLYEQLGIS
jgi:hypothetical protein